MKNLIFALMITVLAGCSLLNTSDFDNAEYDDFITVMTLAEQTKPYCGSDKSKILPRAFLLDGHAHHLQNYTLHRINNEATNTIADLIREDTTELLDRYNAGSKVNKIYCESKLDNIIGQAKIGADAVQKKVRR